MSEIYFIQKFNKRDFIREEVLATGELLGISRARMSRLIQDGKIVPCKKLGSVSLFLKEDILHKKAELEQLRKQYRPYDYE